MNLGLLRGSPHSTAEQAILRSPAGHFQTAALVLHRLHLFPGSIEIKYIQVRTHTPFSMFQLPYNSPSVPAQEAAGAPTALDCLARLMILGQG